MTLWFSASAVIPQLELEWHLTGGEQSWLTMSVQLGFVVGAVASALTNLADRVPGHRLIAASAVLGAMANASIPVLDLDVAPAIVMRFLTGVALAGVYPPGMKVAATWSKSDRGLWIGVLVGALTLGSATPHLLNAVPLLGNDGMPPWRGVLYGASLMAFAAAIIVFAFVRSGPHAGTAARFDWRFATQTITYRPLRLVNFGYLGHMWELYAMWSWVPICLLASYQEAGWSTRSARLAGFAAVGIGALGCTIAGVLADRLGRSTVTIVSLCVSGLCTAVAGLLFAHPEALTALCLIWGFAVVADSAQFSAGVSELADDRYIGTALTMQTSIGFLLTLLTIRLVPVLVELVGWRWVFVSLFPGPVFGAWSMWRLRGLPEASRMASGRR